MLSIIVQNEGHAQNALAIVKDLPSQLAQNVRIVCLDSMSGLNTKALIPKALLFDDKLERSEKPFYLQGSVERAVYLFRNRRAAAAAVSDCTHLLIGNDGAMQRMMIRMFRRNSPGRVILLLDGLLTARAPSFSFVLKRYAGLLTRRTFLTPYLPSLVGHGDVDDIFVMNDSVKKILIDQGVREPIRVAYLPRFSNLLKAVRRLKDEQSFAFGEDRLLYATSAFKWHGEAELAQCQATELDDLYALARKHMPVRIRIRRHPREPIEDYSGKELSENVALSDPSTPLADDLAWATAMLTGRSSAAVEAELVGLPVFISKHRFPIPHETDYLRISSNIRFVSDFSAVIGADALSSNTVADQNGSSVTDFLHGLMDNE